MLTDEEYLDAVEVSFFLGDLLSYIGQHKSLDKLDLAKRYFSDVRSRQHVLGASYAYVMECNHNRRSLVYCFMEAFKSFPATMELTALDFFHLVESICPTLPKSIVVEAASCTTPVIGSNDVPSTDKFYFNNISNSVYFYIIYDEWLKLITEYFKTESTLDSISIVKIKAQVEEFRTTFTPSLCQPPLDIVLGALNTLEGNESCSRDISLQSFRRALFASKEMTNELFRLAYQHTSP